MKTIIVLLWIFPISFNGIAQINYIYERNQTFTYEEAIEAYRYLNKTFSNTTLKQIGLSDAGIPIYLFGINTNPQAKNPKLFINNGIHPGEPCGVDASIKFCEDLLKSNSAILNNIEIYLIPIYNVGGALNRNSHTRANQNGPEEYGFRGNARNLDLNRDFIKCDSENAKTFTRVFQQLKPDFFVDTHTSNGADYPYTMTLITNQLDNINPVLKEAYSLSLIPYLYDKMESTYPMVPYMNTLDGTPEGGISDFLDSPRYSSGYTSLFNCMSFTTEAHMLKSFRSRVEATYDFLNHLSLWISENGTKIRKVKQDAFLYDQNMKEFGLNFILDTTVVEKLSFESYPAKYTKSSVTGLDRLYYDTENPKQIEIDYFKHYQPSSVISIPEYYVISQVWKKVIERLELNQIRMIKAQKDFKLNIDAQYIAGYETFSQPFEGHYLHYKVSTENKEMELEFRQGDYIIPTRQPNIRYLFETLEATAGDSFFCWNFFDEILQQKEYFSPYVFEPEAEKILATNPILKSEFEKKKSEDESFAKNSWAQLMFIYQKSNHYEPVHLRYPVVKVFENNTLPSEIFRDK